MALKAVASSGGGGGGLIGSAGSWSVQLSNAAGSVVNGTLSILLAAPFDFTFTDMYYTTDSGSFDVEVQIAGVSVGGFSQTVSGAGAVVATSANVCAAGDDVVAIITNSTGNPVNAAFQLLYTRDSV